jgi:hypothetical protein
MGMTVWTTARFGSFGAEEKSGRGQRGDHGLGDACLEGFVRLAVGGLGQKGQRFDRGLVRGLAIGTTEKAPKDFPKLR